MPKRGGRVNRTPDSGYKFECQHCEDEVYQPTPPQLIFRLTKDGRHIVSEAVQACEECHESIVEMNKKVTKGRKEVPQVRPLREGSELPPDLQAAKAELEKPSSSATDAKIDKLCDAVGQLANMMAQFMQSQIQVQPNTPTPEQQRAWAEDDAQYLTARKVDAESKTTKRKPAPAKKAKPASGGATTKRRTANTAKGKRR